MTEDTMKTKDFMADMEWIENTSNYYAMFLKTYERSCIAHQNLLKLFDAGAISDLDLHLYSDRITKAKEAMIKAHLAWTLKAISKDLTVEQAVYSVYNDIFSTDLKE